MDMKVIDGKLRVTTVRDVTVEALEEEQTMLMDERERCAEEIRRIDADLEAVGLKLQMIADAEKVVSK